jgi:hypothetical protein
MILIIILLLLILILSAFPLTSDFLHQQSVFRHHSSAITPSGVSDPELLQAAVVSKTFSCLG